MNVIDTRRLYKTKYNDQTKGSIGLKNNLSEDLVKFVMFALVSRVPMMYLH